jgi:hypothetical protein
MKKRADAAEKEPDAYVVACLKELEMAGLVERKGDVWVLTPKGVAIDPDDVVAVVTAARRERHERWRRDPR